MRVLCVYCINLFQHKMAPPSHELDTIFLLVDISNPVSPSSCKLELQIKLHCMDTAFTKIRGKLYCFSVKGCRRIIGAKFL